jgi:hypothetical protein
MPKISWPTKSFIILFCVAVFGVFLCLNLLWDMSDSPYSQYNNLYYNYDAGNMPASTTPKQKPAQVPAPTVDTSLWKTYSNSKFNFSFKYPSGWKVLAATKSGDYSLVQVDPGAKYYNIKIYISAKDYFALGGLPTQADVIGGQPALNVHNMLYGVKPDGNYYTFDIGSSLSLTPNFDAMVHSVVFTN